MAPAVARANTSQPDRLQVVEFGVRPILSGPSSTRPISARQVLTYWGHRLARQRPTTLAIDVL